jgi:hypothetical protein
MVSSYYEKYEFASQDIFSNTIKISRQGAISATFAQLTECLGPPAFEGKCDNMTTKFIVKWINNDNGRTGTFSLYDLNYTRNFENDYKEITWNIGGKNYSDVMAAAALMKTLT